MGVQQSPLSKESKLYKQLYFFLFLAMGLVGPFSVIFLKRVLVLDSGEPDMVRITFIMSTLPIIAFCGNLFAGVVSDRFQIGRRLIAILSAVSILPAIMLGLLGSSLLSSISISGRFALIAFFYSFYFFCAVPINMLLDSEVLRFLNENADRSSYGRYRIWGTIGWGVVAVFAGLFLTYAPFPDGLTEYRIIFYGASIAFFIVAILSGRQKSGSSLGRVEIPWRYFLRDKHYFLFLIFTFMGGVVDSSVNNQYMGFFLDDVLSSPLQIGLIFGFWTTFELPIMHYSNFLIGRFGSRKLMMIGILFSILKLYAFSMFTPETPYIYKFAASLLHGPAFACVYLAMVNMVDSFAPKGMRATYMSVNIVVRTTIASVVGGFLGGLILAKWDGRALMYFGIIVLSIKLLYFITFVKTKEAQSQ